MAGDRFIRQNDACLYSLSGQLAIKRRLAQIQPKDKQWSSVQCYIYGQDEGPDEAGSMTPQPEFCPHGHPPQDAAAELGGWLWLAPNTLPAGSPRRLPASGVRKVTNC